MPNAYEEGRAWFRPFMAMSASDRCPYPGHCETGRFSEDRKHWMSGFFDAYFQHRCDKNGWGKW